MWDLAEIRHHYWRVSPRRHLRNFIQRGTRGFSQEDAWSLDHYLAHVIGNSFIYLSEHSCGWDDSEFASSDEQAAAYRALGEEFLFSDEQAAAYRALGEGFLFYGDWEAWHEQDRDALERQMRLHRMFVKLERYFTQLWD